MPKRSTAIAVAAIALATLIAHPAAGSSRDPYLDKQWGLERIRAEEAWKTADGSGTLIAIVDSGIDLGHPDLAANVVSHPDADLVDGRAPCEKAGSKSAKDCDPDGAQDANGHGTHVAGIAAAVTGNGTGVAGTAPEARLLPVRVLDEDASGETERVADGIVYAVDNGADVINLSLSYRPGEGDLVRLTGELKPIYDALAYAADKGVVTVAAAGNYSSPLCAEPSAAPGVVCVGATDQRDVRSYFSNGDATQMKNYLVAPGGEGLTCEGEIFSTYLREAETLCSGEDGYDGISGTSMAAPFVSGVAALLISKGLDASQTVACLRTTAVDLGSPGRDPVYGHGRVDALAAVTRC